MPADSTTDLSVERQALEALEHLSEEDKGKVLSYIQSLLILDQSNHDQASSS
jgi:hypothetical protein